MRRQKITARGRWGRLTAALGCLLGFGNFVRSQGPSGWDPVKTTCNMVLARAVVVGSKMYVDGGEIIDEQNYQDGIDKPYRSSEFTQWQNQHLWELDLSQKFNVSKPPWTAHTKPGNWNEHYNGVSGTLWNVGDGKFYTLGGKFSSYEGPPMGHRIREPYYIQNTSGYYFQLPDVRVFAYSPGTGRWSSQLQTDVSRIVSNAYTQSARNKIGYTLGGIFVMERDFSTKEFFAPTSVGGWLDSMSAYDFKTGKFSFSTVPDGIGKTIMVLMHSLDRVGKEGILVAFAGRFSKNNIEQVRPMNEIWIYDIKTSSWMKQKATGEVPSPRFSTCSVLVPAPDLSSFQIYVFSGIIEGKIRILDLYVLSIPAFTWTKIELKNYPNEWPIADMSCALYEGRQFIIVPGEVNVTTVSSADRSNYFWECNKHTAVHVFDTYDWEFKGQFDPANNEPKVPPAIINLIGGNYTGGATVKQPQAGWDNETLGTIFSIRNEPLPHELESPSPNPNITTGPPPNAWGEAQQMTNPRRGVIIGGVVGGVCLVVFMAGIVIFAVKRCGKPSELESNTAELHGKNNHQDEQFELHAYEPPEMGEAVECSVLVTKEEEKVTMPDPFPTQSLAHA